MWMTRVRLPGSRRTGRLEAGGRSNLRLWRRQRCPDAVHSLLRCESARAFMQWMGTSHESRRQIQGIARGQVQRPGEQRDRVPASSQASDGTWLREKRGIHMSDMTGKVALITGASSGIGRVTAEAFAAKGARVVLAARRQDELASFVTEIEARGGKATAVKTDVSAARDVERMVAHALETFGRIDYAVNNAGIEGRLASITELAEDDWDRVLDINLKGTFLCLKYAARAILAGGHGGAIVNIGSVNSFLGFGTGSAYVASKHGLVGLTTSVSAELAPQGIRVNIVSGLRRYTDASRSARDCRRRSIRQNLAPECSSAARRSPGGDRSSHRLPMLG